MDLYEKIVAIRKEGRRAALATIVRRRGSTPRKDSAKMLIEQDGTATGSVGGGCLEAEVWQQAKEVLASGRSAFLSFDLNEQDAANEGLVCGGTVEIFIEPIMSDPNLIIIGAGHLGKAVAELAKPSGFDVTVLDDRDSFANRERFPSATRIVADEFGPGLSQLTISPETFIVIVTRGHSHDQFATELALQTPARYVGLVGSRRKIKMITDALLAAGLSRDLFAKLYSPIGLEIGAETPEEIAISIVAELIAVRKGSHSRNDKQNWILEQIRKRPQ